MHSVQVLRDTASDLDLQVVGTTGDTVVLYDPDESHSAVKVQSIIYAIEAGARVKVRWEVAGGLGILLVPLEGRGVLDFGKIGGAQKPEGATGRLLIESYSYGLEFFLGFELIKQRS